MVNRCSLLLDLEYFQFFDVVFTSWWFKYFTRGGFLSPFSPGSALVLNQLRTIGGALVPGRPTSKGTRGSLPPSSPGFWLQSLCVCLCRCTLFLGPRSSSTPWLVVPLESEWSGGRRLHLPLACRGAALSPPDNEKYILNSIFLHKGVQVV